MSARPCRNNDRNTVAAIEAEVDPCPITSVSRHKVVAQSLGEVEIQGWLLSKIRHRHAVFEDPTGKREFTLRHWVRTRGGHVMTISIIQGPKGTGQETVENRLTCRGENETPPALPHRLTAHYWTDVL